MLCCENKGSDQLRGYQVSKLQGLSWHGSNSLNFYFSKSSTEISTVPFDRDESLRPETRRK